MDEKTSRKVRLYDQWIDLAIELKAEGVEQTLSSTGERNSSLQSLLSLHARSGTLGGSKTLGMGYSLALTRGRSAADQDTVVKQSANRIKRCAKVLMGPYDPQTPLRLMWDV